MPRVTPSPSSRPLTAHQGRPDSASLFLTANWFDLLQRHALPAQTVRRDASVGRDLCLPLVQERSTFRALSNYYSAIFGLRDDALPSTDEALQLADWFRSHGARRIELRPLYAAAPLLRLLQHALRQRGYLSDTYRVSTNWYLPCADLSWADYLAARPSRLSNTLRRCRKRLDAEHAWHLDIVTTTEKLGPALAAYLQVYAQSWKEPEPYPDFIPELCRMGAGQDWLRLGVLYMNDAPVAAQIWFVKDGTASIYKLAYDSRFAKLGVGTVLTAALAEHVLEVDKVREIDFLTGDDAYKADWMTHARELVGFVAFDARSPLGLLQAAEHFARRWLRRRVDAATRIRAIP